MRFGLRASISKQPKVKPLDEDHSSLQAPLSPRKTIREMTLSFETPKVQCHDSRLECPSTPVKQTKYCEMIDIPYPVPEHLVIPDL